MESYSFISGNSSYSGAFKAQVQFHKNSRLAIVEIPEWMFDSRAYGRMKPAELPQVDCAALLVLQHLFSAATGPNEPGAIQVQHHSGSSGDADAQTDSVQNPSRRVVFSTSEAPRVTSGSAAEDGSTAVQDAEGIFAAAPQCHETGGER
jgi:hypothetical protein